MLLSSTAETMYWAGRYIERAQALSRAVQSYERVSLDLPSSGALDLRPVLGLVAAPADGTARGSIADALHALILDRENPSSVSGAISRARENLRRGRIVTPPAVWEAINQLHQALIAVDGFEPLQVLRMLDHVNAACTRIEGEIDASMTRDAAYSFLRVGLCLERADMLLRILAALVPALTTDGEQRAFDDVRWVGLLQAIAAQPMHRLRHDARGDLASSLAFVLRDEAFPRSLVHCLHAIDRELASLPRSALVRAVLDSCRPEQVADVECRDARGVQALCARLLDGLREIDACLAGTYFGDLGENAVTPSHVGSDKLQLPWKAPRMSCCGSGGGASLWS